MFKAGLGIALAAVLAISAFGVSAGATAGDDGRNAQAKRASCGPSNVEEARSFHTTYVFPPIKTRGVSCGKAKKIIRSFHDCRKDRGGKNGRCKSRVRGFKCREGKREGVKGVNYTANVKCKRGTKRVKHQYQQAL